MTNPDHTDTITNEILSNFSLREKNIIAHMDEMDVEILVASLERYVEATPNLSIGPHYNKNSQGYLLCLHMGDLCTEL